MAFLPQQRLASRHFDPLRELEDFRERMRGVLEATFAGLPEVGEGVWSPLVDVEETDDAYILEAELPGVDRKDVRVELEGSELVIAGERKERPRSGVLRRRGRVTGRFEYRIALGQEIDPERIDASLVDGVLTLRVPKGERAQRRKIEVKTGAGRTPAGRTSASPARARTTRRTR
jgi:HSP20 family protein